MSATLAVEDVLRHVTTWSGRAAVSTAGLGVPPAQEIDNTLRAARSGVGARVFEVLPDVKWGQAVRDLDAPDLGALMAAAAAGRPVNSSHP